MKIIGLFLISFILISNLVAEDNTQVQVTILNANKKNGLDLVNYNQDFSIEVYIRNISTENDLKYLKIKFSKSFTDYFDITEIEPKPESESSWGPFNLSFKWKKEIIIKPQQTVQIKFHCNAKENLGQVFGEISVHGMAGMISRFDPTKVSLSSLVILDPANPSLYTANSGFFGAFMEGFKEPFESLGLIDETNKIEKKEFIDEEFPAIWPKFASSSKLTDLQKQNLWSKNYKNKWIKGSGYIVSVNKFFGKLSVQLSAKNKNESVIIIGFDDYWEEELIELSKGDKINFEAMLTSYNSILGLSANNGILK